MTDISEDFVAAVHELMEGAYGFLVNDDGNDDKWIDIMNGGVGNTLRAARKIPALADLADKFDADAIMPRLYADE
jgi:hypothetical protein